jgi:hypothetical protein
LAHPNFDDQFACFKSGLVNQLKALASKGLFHEVIRETKPRVRMDCAQFFKIMRSKIDDD